MVRCLGLMFREKTKQCYLQIFTGEQLVATVINARHAGQTGTRTSIIVAKF